MLIQLECYINRKAELELASLDPFLEKLPEETRFKVKEELTSKFFGSSTADIKDDEPVTPGIASTSAAPILNNASFQSKPLVADIPIVRAITPTMPIIRNRAIFRHLSAAAFS